MKLTLTTLENPTDGYPIAIDAMRWWYVDEKNSSNTSDLSMRSMFHIDVPNVELGPYRMKEFNRWFNKDFTTDEQVEEFLKNRPKVKPQKALEHLFDFTFFGKFVTKQNEKVTLTDIHDFKETKDLVDIYDVELSMWFDYEDALTKLLVGDSKVFVNLQEEFNRQRFAYYKNKYYYTPMVRATLGNYHMPSHCYDVNVRTHPFLMSKNDSYYSTYGQFLQWRKENPDAPLEYNTPKFKTPEDEELYRKVRSDDEWWNSRLKIQK